MVKAIQIPDLVSNGCPVKNTIKMDRFKHKGHKTNSIYDKMVQLNENWTGPINVFGF